MSEEKIARRGWVKNAAIIFLAVMLVLTFFSSSIMNRSLPEVAVQYVETGSISTRVRGSGTVTANERYEVKIEQSRKVESVKVRTGDTVAPGDVLFILSDSESQEIETEQELLDQMILAYRTKLLNDSYESAKEDRALTKLRQTLTDAQAKAAESYVSPSALNAAKDAAKHAQEVVTRLEQDLKELSAVGGDAMEAKLAWDEAAIALEAAKIAYQSELIALDEAARQMPEYNGGNLEECQKALVIIYGNSDDTYAQSIAKAYNAVDSLENDVFNKYQAYEAASKAQNESEDYKYVERKLAEANEELTFANEQVTELSTRQSAYEEAESAAKLAQEALDDALFEQSASEADTIAQMELAAEKKALDKQQQKVNELRADSVAATVAAPVGGLITAVNVSPGGTTGGDTALAVIEVPDMGYSISFAVSREQAAKVRVGDTAEVTNYYWGSSITATLAAIKNDPNNPGQSKLLEFSISGDVDSGAQLTLSVGQQSANYDLIVPNSALRSDSDGDFVLMIVAKNTPLGNRYTAKRVDVNILAQDDNNAAVSGSLVAYDYVITTSARPIEAKQQVRLAE